MYLKYLAIFITNEFVQFCIENDQHNSAQNR